MTSTKDFAGYPVLLWRAAICQFILGNFILGSASPADGNRGLHYSPGPPVRRSKRTGTATRIRMGRRGRAAAQCLVTQGHFKVAQRSGAHVRALR